MEMALVHDARRDLGYSPPGTPTVGDYIHLRWTDGTFWSARVVGFNSVHILVYDKDEDFSVEDANLRRLSKK